MQKRSIDALPRGCSCLLTATDCEGVHLRESLCDQFQMAERSVPSRKSGKRGGGRLPDGTRLADHGAKRHRDPPRGEPIVFVDCPDPDNFVLVVAANLLRGCTRVVLTGRPAIFGIKSRPFSVRTCARAADEVDIESDSVLALRATAAHLKSVAASQGCSDLKSTTAASRRTRRSRTPSTCTSFFLEGATSARPTTAFLV